LRYENISRSSSEYENTSAIVSFSFMLYPVDVDYELQFPHWLTFTIK
jgi:hypothetical protein